MDDKASDDEDLCRRKEALTPVYCDPKRKRRQQKGWRTGMDA